MAVEELLGSLPRDWEYTTLGAACERGGGDIQTGPFGSQLHASDYVAEGIPSIMPQNIGDNRIIEDAIARMTPEDAKRLSRYLVRRGDIVYSRRGDVERRALIREHEDGWLCGTGCLRVRLGEKTVNPRYAFFYLGHPNVREWIVRHAHGATMPNLNTSILAACPFVVPPQSEQLAIAHILGTLDDKIELNRRMNETLEAIARALFESWFVRFDPVRRNMARKGRGQPSPRPSPRGRGRNGEGGAALHYRGGYDFAGLVETARTLRKKQTSAEAIFWELVRDRRFLGLKFRRQHQVGDYVADFYCHEHRLVVELDGGIHSAKRKKDVKRDAWMEAQGMTILRFSNDQLLDDPVTVLSTIARTVLPSPHGRGVGDEGVIESGAAFPLPLGEGQGEGSVEELDRLFPARLVDSELGEIPEGWEVGTLESLASIQGGKQLPTEDCRPHGAFPVYGANGIMGFAERATHRGFVIAFGRVGAYCGSVHWTYDGAWINNNASSVVPGRWPEYVLQVMLAADFEGMRTGSAQPFIPNSSLASMLVVRASERILDGFCSIAGPLRLREQATVKESRTLAALRDTLLSKLISGELRVKDAERFVERAI